MEPNNHSYLQQNELLAQLHRQRKARDPQFLVPKSLRADEPEPEKKAPVQKAHHLYLNYLIYDSRPHRPQHYMRIHRYFNEDPSLEQSGFDPKKKVKSIFMTTYGFQTDMLAGIAGIGCNMVVANDSNNPTLTYNFKYSGFDNWTVVNLPKKRSGVFHTKIWLVKFESFLRVIVSTGNLHTFDWSIWSNAIWYQDFQMKTLEEMDKAAFEPEDNLSNLDYDFFRTLKTCLEEIVPHQVFEQKVKIRLDDYTFCNVKVVLIPSVPGNYKKGEASKYGLDKVQKAIRIHNSVDMTNSTVTVNCSSVGSLDKPFLESFYRHFTLSDKFSYDKFRLVFPSKQYVQNQMQGSPDCLFHNANYLQKHPETKAIYYRLQENPLNPGGNISPHLKTVVVEPENSDKVLLYVGSHNLSKAAWGTQLKNGDKSYNNSELGVLFLDFDKKEIESWLPFKYPPQTYQAGQTPFTRSF